jgi:transcriptional regulator with XRE-family HTH domain
MSSSAPALYLGIIITEDRRARGWPLRELARRAGLSVGGLHAIEHGKPASLETYAAIGRALGRELRVDLVDPRRRTTARAEDPVHAAMGEVIARRLVSRGAVVSIDEPYQHFQFAGRADVLAWKADATHLLHVENRTRFPNIQEAAGSFNAKRRYLPGVIAERLGRAGRGFESVPNVMAVLWSSEAIHALRLHPATFAAMCPDPPQAFEAWWGGEERLVAGVTSTLVLLDPAPATTRHRAWTGLEDATRPRYRGLADAATAVSPGGVSRS